MSHDAVAPVAGLRRHTSAVERLDELTGALAEDLDEGRWAPAALERTLASRLLVACAGDGQFTPARLRETLWEGSVALTYAGGGRLARLLAQLCAVTAHPAPHAEPALSAGARLLERVAQGASADGDRL
ncbi:MULTISPECIES: hypothetical protein [Streptomyces]|uniref:Acyl-CoA dehydrogenase n=1 Tax=Streptomyces flaveolus TaxID=67297 RepID=A0ABV3AQ95_9ACTN|nr:MULTISPECIES: hypothetical protein [Streptomyces]KMS67436.1 hypothetical protein ACZ91_67280 [Streptomyces regensis]KOG75160.1 hypothetical protein ADK77_02975 [Streptomyces antibioticus]KOV71684.1 hypothetical protein ADL02_45705 [Streptomyces sp. NRRL WC-3723]